MDMTLELVIASTAVSLTGLVFCLEIVGFGRVAIISAMIAIASVVASLGCLQLIGSVWDSAAPHELNVLGRLARTDRLLWISQTLQTTAVVSAIVFTIVGSLRVWRRRSVLVARFSSYHDGSADISDSTDVPEVTTRDCICAGVAIVVVTGFIGWELFDFAVTNQGVQYYRDHPLMLLLPVGLAALVGVVLTRFSQYARRHTTIDESRGAS
jgi:hypothetical protein